ncbi:Retrovirus-related Pol polyprotein from transposon TNT 1-94 [Vitis vinifera]|uniref:Retrovirus-related Pol polyprotein from transposon TNT 1-94 n=1 Tax=Vitis vinifera TaxID=29760 RepID=A0A438CJ13_VITVI|nr:Retrovirus-related Pol polyprotein from transposon TNT 1-94 [Vitis vinifera]
MLLMSYVELYKAKREDAWFLDSGCSNHMCNDQTMFNELDEKFRHSVKLGNNTKMDMMGKGSVKLLLDGVNHVVVEVYYILELRNNLLSIGQLQERGLAILIKGGMCEIFHLEKVLSDKNSKLVSPLASEIWASELQGFENLVVQEHDICGPITPSSNSNKRYILLFIDDYSRKAWVYFLVENSKTLNSFKAFKTMVEKETGLFVKCFRTDRGGEFNSNELNDFCKQSGIKRQLTTAYTPQQNGVAERKNRTMMNMVRSMLSNKNIPKTFWPEAVNWTIYVLNRCPTLAVKNVTPEKAWSGVKPSVDHFWVFGCIAHVHVPEEMRTKLDNRSITCVILGVSEESKGYMLFDPIAKRVVVSRDIIFEEEKQWDWDVSYEEQMVADLEWGDGDGENEKGVSENENRENTDGEVEETHDKGVGSSEGEERVRELRQSRDRQPPTWMGDYVSGEGLFKDEIHITLVESTDPLYFEEAVKNANWRLAMNNEIKSIEKNQTWTLTKLPTGAKKKKKEE